MKYFFSILLLLAGTMPLLKAQAHVTENSFERIEGQYKVDVGYDVSSFAANVPVTFDFNAIDNSSGNAASFTDVWVRIFREDGTVLATGIHRPLYSVPRLVYAFPAAGSYSLDVLFESDDKKVVETVFPIQVNAAPMVAVMPSKKKVNFASKEFYISLIGGLVLGFVAGRLIKRKL